MQDHLQDGAFRGGLFHSAGLKLLAGAPLHTPPTPPPRPVPSRRGLMRPGAPSCVCVCASTCRVAPVMARGTPRNALAGRVSLLQMAALGRWLLILH